MQIGIAMRKPSGLTLPQRIRQLFAAGEQGVWYDPSDFSTMFQDSAGTTPITAVEQPVGLILDKSKGLALGAELVTNGTFDTDIAGWSSVVGAGTGGTVSWDAGRLKIVGDGTNYSFAVQTLALTVGKTYEVVFTTSGLQTYVSGGLVSSSNFPAGTHTFRLIPTTANPQLKFTPSGGLGTTYIDNISVKELPGNHATQATSTKRPVLSAKVNLLTGSAALATQSVTTAAIPYTLKHTGTGTITLSGTSTAGPLVGPGTLTFTPTAGTLTLTVTGSVTEAQLETGSVATRYQWVNTVADYDTVGFNKYLKFDGVDDTLVTESINFTAGDKMTVVAGVRKPDDASFRMIFELSGNTDSSNGAFNGLSSYLYPNGKGAYFGSGVRGSTPVSYISTGAVYPAPISAIQTLLLNIAIDTQIIRINGTQAASGVADLGTGNFGDYPLYIGSRAGTSLPFNGNIYSLIIRGVQSTDAQIINAETYVNSKTGAY